MANLHKSDAAWLRLRKRAEKRAAFANRTDAIKRGKGKVTK
jgi:hypothetical protein